MNKEKRKAELQAMHPKNIINIVIELEEENRKLKQENSRMSQKISDDSWTLNPDRMGRY